MGTPDPSVPASAIVTDYYSRFEDELELCVVRPAEVANVTSADPGTGPLQITVRLDGERVHLTSDFIINATGTWTHPYVPFVPSIAEFEGLQLHTAQFRGVEDFRGLRTLVVGGGISATQFLLQLAEVTDTLWATRRPPNFTAREFDGNWGLEVERAVRSRTLAGLPPASVVRTTGLPRDASSSTVSRPGSSSPMGCSTRSSPTASTSPPAPPRRPPHPKDSDPPGATASPSPNPGGPSPKNGSKTSTSSSGTRASEPRSTTSLPCTCAPEKAESPWTPRWR